MAFPIIKGGDVSTERLRSDRLNLTTFEIESGYGRSRIRGDLVYSIRGSIGEVAIVPDELEGANLTQDAARIAYTPATYGRWLLHVLKSAVVFAQVEAGALGATISGVNIRDLKRERILTPAGRNSCPGTGRPRRSASLRRVPSVSGRPAGQAAHLRYKLVSLPSRQRATRPGLFQRTLTRVQTYRAASSSP
jgi:hypothetical protein